MKAEVEQHRSENKPPKPQILILFFAFSERVVALRPGASTEVAAPSLSVSGAAPVGLGASEMDVKTRPNRFLGAHAWLLEHCPRGHTLPNLDLSPRGQADAGSQISALLRSAASAEARAPLAPTAAPMAAPLAAPLAAPRAQMTVSASQLLPGSPQRLALSVQSDGSIVNHLEVGVSPRSH